MICRPRFGHTSAAQGGKSRQTFANIGAVGHTRSASTQRKTGWIGRFSTERVRVIETPYSAWEADVREVAIVSIATVLGSMGRVWAATASP